MVEKNMEFLTSFDPEVGAAVKAEYDRQRRNIELIASENFVSPAVLAAVGTVLTNKYAEGYPGKRYYGGCQCVDVVVCTLTRSRRLPVSAPASCLAQIMPMCSPTRVPALTMPYIKPCAMWAIPCWA